MTFIELFAGIGGFRYGLEKANKMLQLTTKKSKQTKPKIQFRGKWASVERRRNSLLFRSEQSNGYRCIWANEWDKYACQVYRKNFGKGKLYEGDIRTINTDKIPDHDLLTAGFPCQAFSIAGKRKGFDDTRGTLFFEIGRVLQYKKPEYFILENVKGLLSHNNGQTFETIITSLNELGYDVQWQVLNSKNFGVPQNRERVFIIGHLRETRRPEVFPIRKNDKVDNSAFGKKRQNIQTYRCLEETEYKGISSERFDGIYQEMKIRRLTPIECERLQGFPDNWTEGVSDTQRYKMLGNAVTTNVIYEIGRRLLCQVGI